MRHVAVMTAAGAMGLLAIFLVDFANLFYISLLGDTSLTAAIGYATIVLYFHVSFCMGLMIAAVALTSQALGAEDHERARRTAGSALVIVAAVAGGLALISLPLIDWMLGLVGAQGETKEIAAWFMLITLPTMPLLGLGLCLVGILRAAGDAKRSMYTTLILGLVTAALDPILIYALELGVTGAAIVLVISRALALAYGLWAVIAVHRLVAWPSPATVLTDLGPLARIGIPAILTNIATPVGNGYVTHEVAAFGDAAVAGWTIVSRLIPVAFGVLFALSGAIGPIVGQNFGARAFDRVRQTVTDAMLLTGVYTVVVSIILFLGANQVAAIFGAHGEDAHLVIFFCQFLVISFVFNAGLFVANAAFNNLGYPLLATLFNWGRATIGIVPFVWFGARIGGAEGALAGYAIGAIPFGMLALFICYRLIRHLRDEPHSLQRSPVWRSLAVAWGKRSAA